MSVSSENFSQNSDDGLAPSSLFAMPRLDIPAYHLQEYGSGNNSTHTTPLSYMHKPSSLVNKIDQIEERDYISDRDSDDFDKQLSKLTVGISDDFFQLQTHNGAELEELEPSTGELRREENLINSIHEPSVSFLGGSNLDDNTALYTAREHIPAKDLLAEIPPRPASSIFTGSMLVIPPSNGNYLSDFPENRSPSYAQTQPAYHSQQQYQPANAVTPKQAWAPQGSLLSQNHNQHQQSTNNPSGLVNSSLYQSMPPHAGQQPPYIHQEQNQLHFSQQSGKPPAGMQAPVGFVPQPQGVPRRVGPATPSLLSSYATASAQPHLSPKFAVGANSSAPLVSQSQQGHSFQPQQHQQEYRPAARGEDLARYPTDRGYPSQQSGARTPTAYGAAQQQASAPPRGPQVVPPQNNYHNAGHNAQTQQYHQASASRPGQYAPHAQSGQPGMGSTYSSNAAYVQSPVDPDFIFQVQFKRTTKFFTNRSGYPINVRDFVVVEGDRGEDLGVVVAVLTMQDFVHRRMNDPRAAADNNNVDCILRLATIQERQQLPDKFNAEKNIVQACNELAMHGFGLPIMVYDAEFQFDRNKLTIYYECHVRIDFRDFVRQLYSTYKARIWMKIGNINTPIDVQPLAVMALASGVHFSAGAGAST